MSANILIVMCFGFSRSSLTLKDHTNFRTGAAATINTVLLYPTPSAEPQPVIIQVEPR